MDKRHSRTTETAVRLVTLPREEPADPEPEPRVARPSAMLEQEPRVTRPSGVMERVLESAAEPAVEPAAPATLSVGLVARELLALPPRLVRAHRARARVRALLEREGTLFRPVDLPVVEAKQRAALSYLLDTHGTRQLGDYLEFGLGDGSFFASMHAQLGAQELRQVRLFGFDGFAASLAEPFALPRTLADLDRRTAEHVLVERGLDPERCALIEGASARGDSGPFRNAHWVRKASVIALDLHGAVCPAAEVLRFCESMIGLEACIFVVDRSVGTPVHRRIRQRRVFGEFLRTRPGFTLHERGSDDGGVSCYLLRRTAG